MIKKYLLGLGISFLSLIGLSYAQYDQYNGDLPLSFYQGNNYNEINTNLNFDSERIDLENGFTNKSLYFSFNDNTIKSIFWNNGKLYFYEYFGSNDTTIQGYYDKVCKYYSEDGTFEGYPCIDEEYQDISIFYNLKNPNFTKARVYPAGGVGNIGFYDSNTKYYYYFNVHFLTGSLNITNGTNNFDDYTKDSPFTSTPNYIYNEYCPTIAQILKTNYTNNYNTGLCYNNTTYFNGTSFETITKDNIFTIFNDNYENYTNRISIYRNNCTNTNTTQACQNAFSGEYKKYSIIANAQQSNVDEKKLWNYCNMSLNYDPNTTTCVGSGLLKEQPTQEEILDDILNMNSGIPIPGNENNNVFDALCDPNNPENCYGTGNVRDIFGSMQRIYGKITGLFTKRNGVNGIIPDYILRITFLTILFTIIFKK